MAAKNPQTEEAAKELGVVLAAAHLPRNCRLRAERIVSPALLMSARAPVGQLAQEEMSRAVATEILRRSDLYRVTRDDHNIGGTRFTIDTVVLSPEHLLQVLTEVWRAGFNAKKEL